MKVVEIYRKYKIPDHLVLHMLRVSALAKIITDSSDDIEGENVLQACLLHDLGNIVKFVDIQPNDWTREKGVDYWLSVQKQFWKKYGHDDHRATLKILHELGVSTRIKELSEMLRFEPEVFGLVSKGRDLEMKVLLYSDSRISPRGIVSVEERLSDIEKRYVGVEGRHKLNRGDFEATKVPILEVALQIEEMVSIDLDKLTNADLESYFGELLEYDITVNEDNYDLLRM